MEVCCYQVKDSLPSLTSLEYSLMLDYLLIKPEEKLERQQSCNAKTTDLLEKTSHFLN